MKKNVLLFILLFAVNHVDAQFYVGLDIGYGLGVQGRGLGDFLITDVVSQNEIDAKEKISSLGGGFRISPTVGYTLNEKLSFELDIGYQHTNKVTGFVDFNSIPVDRTDLSLQGDFIFVSPSVMGTIYDKGVRVYTRIGAIYSQGQLFFDYENTSGNSITITRTLISGGGASGLVFGVGCEWNMRTNIKFRSELKYNSSNYYPRTAELKLAIEDDIDVINRIPLADRVTTYSKTGNSNGEFYGASLQNGTVLRPQIPMNGFGLNIGLIYSFSKKNTVE